MSFRHSLAAALLAGAGLVNAQAAALPGDGSWSGFLVSSAGATSGGLEWIDDTGAPLNFDFSIPLGQQGLLTVVDAGFAGDSFKVYSGSGLIGSTSAVPVTVYDPNTAAIVDFDAALADPAFSRGSFTLDAGSYRVIGVLDRSVLLSDGARLDATIGGVRLLVSAVPEPGSLALLLVGLGLLAVGARRRTR